MDKKVLIISRNAWSNNISTGNTLSNLFEGWDPSSIANIYCRSEKIDNQICKKYYQITEKQLIKSMIGRDMAGKEVLLTEMDNTKEEKNIENNKKVYSFFRKFKLTIFLWIRELIWLFGNWKNERINNYLEDFKPEIVFMPIYDCFYMHRILQYVKKKSGAKVVLWTGDDMYSLKQFSLSPLFWINRLILRKYIKQSVKISSIRYCITPEQSEEYQKYFSVDFKILGKEMRQAKDIDDITKNKSLVSLVYTGNIDRGRFKSLIKICEVLDSYHDIPESCFYIYSGSSLSKQMNKKINGFRHTKFMGEVSSLEVFAIQKAADIVVHVESLDIKERLRTRLSLSTKIIDYMSNKCCIFALGWEEASSIKFLERSNSAVICNGYEEIDKNLKPLLMNKDLRERYAYKAYQFVKMNFPPGYCRNILKYDLNNI